MRRLKKFLVFAAAFSAVLTVSAVLWHKHKTLDTSMLRGCIISECGCTFISPRGCNVYTENKAIPNLQPNVSGKRLCGEKVTMRLDECKMPVFCSAFVFYDPFTKEETEAVPNIFSFSDIKCFSADDVGLYYLYNGHLNYMGFSATPCYKSLAGIDYFTQAGETLCCADSDKNIFLYSPENGQKTPLGLRGYEPVISPNGRYVAYRKPDIQNRLFVYDIQTKTEYSRECTGFKYCFSPDGKYAAVSENSRHLKSMLSTEIYIWDFVNDKSALVFDKGSYGAPQIFWGDFDYDNF